MTFANHVSDRRLRTRIRPQRRTEPHPIQDFRRGHASALVLPAPRHKPHTQPTPTAWSSLKTNATTLAYCAGHALPALLLAFAAWVVNWAVAETLSGFAAYAEASYAPPVPNGFAPPAREATDRPQHAKLREVSIARCDIERIVRYGARRE